MKISRAAAILGLTSILTACGESAVIRSYPPGSKLYVNDQFIGLTPIPYSASRKEYSRGEFRVRLERDGYLPLDDKLRTRVCGGRIAGAIFTLGIVFLFKGPTCFQSPQDFSLLAAPGQAQDAGSTSRRPSVDERLQRIERLRNQGTITNEEYERYRKEILHDL